MKLRIAAVSSYKSYYLRSFGGRGFYICRAVAKYAGGFEHVASLRHPGIIRAYFNSIELQYEKYIRKYYSVERDPLLMRSYTRQIFRKLKHTNENISRERLEHGIENASMVLGKSELIINKRGWVV